MQLDKIPAPHGALGAPAKPKAEGQWHPKILAFCCNWCTYAGADLAGLNRMQYPADIRVLRVPCSGRVNPQFVLKALQAGCDGVLVCGCHPGDCHYTSGNYYAKRRMLVYKRLLEFSGLEADRFQIRWISGSEAGKFRDTVTAFTARIQELGPIEGDATYDMEQAEIEEALLSEAQAEQAEGVAEQAEQAEGVAEGAAEPAKPEQAEGAAEPAAAPAASGEPSATPQPISEGGC